MYEEKNLKITPYFFEKQKTLIWSPAQFQKICLKLEENGCRKLKGHGEYELFKQIIPNINLTEVTIVRQNPNTFNPVYPSVRVPSVNLSSCNAEVFNDTCDNNNNNNLNNSRTFMNVFDIQTQCIADSIHSLKAIQSEQIRLNFGLDTESQTYIVEGKAVKFLLSIQMSVDLGDVLVRYFFLVKPKYQRVTAAGGEVPLKYCIADILADLKGCFNHDIPIVRKEKIIYRGKPWTGHEPYKTVDYKAMKSSIVPITIICHSGKADLPNFRRAKYDTDIIKHVSEIQGGLMSVKSIHMNIPNDNN